MMILRMINFETIRYSVIFAFTLYLSMLKNIVGFYEITAHLHNFLSLHKVMQGMNYYVSFKRIHFWVLGPI